MWTRIMHTALQLDPAGLGPELVKPGSACSPWASLQDHWCQQVHERSLWSRPLLRQPLSTGAGWSGAQTDQQTQPAGMHGQRDMRILTDAASTRYYSTTHAPMPKCIMQFIYSLATDHNGLRGVGQELASWAHAVVYALPPCTRCRQRWQSLLQMHSLHCEWCPYSRSNEK